MRKDCLNRPDYDQGYHHHGSEPSPYPGQSFTSEDDYGGGYDQGDGTAEHPFHALKKLLNTGNFYYSVDFDLTRRLQDRIENNNHTVDIASLDEGLLWNSYMIRPLLQFRERLTNHERKALDRSQLLTSVVRGFVRTILIPPSSNPLRKTRPTNSSSSLTVISRLSSRRTGTRFNSRGMDDLGNVANFVETETVLWSPAGICFSYVQVRGSVPIFWESSTSLIPGQHKVQLTRSPEATQPAFDKHFENLEHAYGAVHIVNLLSPGKMGESELVERYRYHIQHSSLRQHHHTDDPEADSGTHELLSSTEFDFHERTKGTGGFEGAKAIRPYLENSAEGFVYFLTEETDSQNTIEKNRTASSVSVASLHRRSSVTVMQQGGVFRVNCMDCLDRTNLVQNIISQMVIELFLSHRAETANADFWMRHGTLWADNGDALSNIYAGTGALKSSFTRHGKMNLAGALADVRKSATRLYVNNFADKGRQNTIDLLLGRLVGQAPVQLFDPINDYVLEQLNSRKYYADFTSCEPVYVWCGTMNLNGKLEGLRQDLAPWLHAKSKGFAFDYDVVCVGFQEIVDLSPQQIMSTDPSIRLEWERKVKEVLNATAQYGSKGEKGGDEYVLLRSGQLVGAALMIFVKARTLDSIRNVEGAIKKTGMSGIAGNKGAVAVRMDIHNTSLCVVTAHLAAGFANYEDRNRDYRTIEHGIRFTGGRGIEDHDAVIWLGDFNYRIGLGHDKARKLVEVLQGGLTGSKAEEAIGKLYENDQLNLQMVHGQAFPWYQEMRVNFLPTYKYDVGTDNYDTSEKARIPAWCDRVVYKANAKSGQDGGVLLKGLEYGSVQNLRFSDHRPVYATFELDVSVIDEEKRSKLAKTLEVKRRAEVEGILRRETSGGTVTGDDEDDTASDSADAEDLMGYDSIADGLPPASSDRRKWWLDGEKPVRSMIGPPKPGMVLNPNRSGNPWQDANGRGRVSSKEDDWVELAADGTAVNGARLTLNRTVSVFSNETIDTVQSKTPPPPVPAPRGARRMVVPVYDGERMVRLASERFKNQKPQGQRPRSGTGTTTDGTDDLSHESFPAQQMRPMSAGSPIPPPSSQPNRSRAGSSASTQSTNAFSNTVRRLPPPIIPSKPVGLRSASNATSPENGSPPSITSPMRPGSKSLGAADVPPTLPSRTTTARTTDSNDMYVSAAENNNYTNPDPTLDSPAARSAAETLSSAAPPIEPAPPLPPRRAQTNTGLMDEEYTANGVEIDGWKPLLS